MLFNTSKSNQGIASGRSNIGRSLMALAASAALALPTASAAAQSVPAFELRPLVGAYVPFGSQGDFLAGSNMYGAQLSWLMTPTWAFTGSGGWTRSQDKLTPVRQDIDLMQFDAGIEARATPTMSANWTIAPFIGIGAGARRYDYKDLDVDSKVFGAGYAALGTELAYRSLGLRFEARDYVSRFKPMTAGAPADWDYRNDMTLSAALNLRIW